ncbi:hypothetical protein BLA60_01700 [Actinophytocola xinjiangensis]|uniref:Peptide/nickel transport system permease protein n=1 Tax=Actinophytocola xinjiangensis TaxID=485602 RepID=A0A7Z0WT54_9PSEU|nr:dipeptide/oligopeptide/nickel ABC transporter permease/ATP-binding protein [Actinophytocola xinjiangensis]OLF13924.1 hypothetical protein BLA60_01700 [Actinophytocola xinjiangensis]
MSVLPRRLRGRAVIPVAGGFLLLLILVAFAAPLVAPHDPTTGDLMRPAQLPSGQHWLGTDSLGRDVLSRIVYGARVALLAALVAVGVAVVIGLPAGLVLGYRGGWADRIVLRAAEGVNAMPFLLVAITFIAVLGPGLFKSMAVVGVVYAVMVLRLVRGETLAAREELYVTGAVVAGASTARILWRHLLPAVAPSLIVLVTTMFATSIVAEATLSYLGLGTQPPDASWGNMLADAQQTAFAHWFPAIPPGVAILVTVLAFNLLGDGLRDAFAREATGSVLDARPPAVTEPDPSLPDEPSTPDAPDTLVAVRGLSVSFPAPGERGRWVPAVTDVSFDIGRGEVVSLVGESGSGKSVTAMALAGLVPAPAVVEARSITFDGRELAGTDARTMRTLRAGSIGVVFQDPLKALNPAFTVGTQLTEGLRVVHGMSTQDARRAAAEWLDRVRIPDATHRLRQYPHEFSGGMAQRVMIAMALSAEPALLIADEPTTALDVTVQGEILDLLRELQEQTGMSLLIITHDQGVVADLAERVLVMYAGELVERGRVADVLTGPRHPYTAGLIASVPRNRRRTGPLPRVRGVVPAAGRWGEGCRFHDRCPFALPACATGTVALHTLDGGASRCLRTGDDLALADPAVWR